MSIDKKELFFGIWACFGKFNKALEPAQKGLALHPPRFGVVVAGTVWPSSYPARPQVLPFEDNMQWQK